MPWTCLNRSQPEAQASPHGEMTLPCWRGCHPCSDMTLGGMFDRPVSLQSSFAQNQKHPMPADMHRYVSDFDPQAIERPADLDGRTHKKTGHKMCIMWRAT